MPLAPEIRAFGDANHESGETGLTIDGAGFGAFPGAAWLFENPDRTGLSDELVVGNWNDIQLTGVDIPAVTNNAAGTVYLFVMREDLAWSQGFAINLDSDRLPAFNTESLVLHPEIDADLLNISGEISVDSIRVVPQ